MPRLDEDARLFELTKIERELWGRGAVIAGMDEVGRGPLAGPVVTACVSLPGSLLIKYINDSKRVSANRREKLAIEIENMAIAYGVAWVYQEEIDEINILNATKKAFAIAYREMKLECSDVLIDAVRGLDIPAAQHSIIHGDAESYLIAAASILAKVKRDGYMVQMAERYPEYGFERNKGYGTAEHIAALKKFGPCPLHRRSFIAGILGQKA